MKGGAALLVTLEWTSYTLCSAVVTEMSSAENWPITVQDMEGDQSRTNGSQPLILYPVDTSSSVEAESSTTALTSFC